MAYTVAQNASFLTFASILQKVVSFAYFTLIAHLIGVENTGSYFFAIAFTTIFAVIADAGFAPVLTRETSKYPEQGEKYLSTVLWSKVLFGFAAYALVAISSIVLGYSQELRNLILLSGVTMFFDNLQNVFFSIFRARKNLLYESVAIVISQLLTMVIGTTALFLHASLMWLILAYTISSFITLLYAVVSLRRAYHIHFRFSIDYTLFKQFVVMAWPFALAGILGRLYSYSDSIIMSKMLTTQDLGWWAVPYKITYAFQFIPVALSASVYPAMSSYSVSDPDKIGELFVKAWKYLFVIVFPLSFGLMAVAEALIVKLYSPRFLPSVPVLQILLISLIFGYLSIISGSLLNATGRQRTQTALVGIALGTNSILNLILIPRAGIIGAAISATMSNAVLWGLGYFFVRKIVKIPDLVLLKYASSFLSLAIVMAAIVYIMTFKLSVLLTVPAGVLMYGFLLFAFKVVDWATIQNFTGKLSLKRSV